MRKSTFKNWYGWMPDIPDQRDFTYAAPARIVKTLPSSMDLRSTCAPVYDQGDLGSCTANAIGAAFEFARCKQKASDFMPSRLFIYYNERVMEHTVHSDAGAQIRDGIKSVQKQGVCHESLWKYDPNKFDERPPQKCYDQALRNEVTRYMRLPQELSQMKGCLASGYPFVFGFTCYDSFESDKVAKTGVLPMPKKNEKQVGGHAIMAVGYDEKSGRLLIRNSWGKDWGMDGYFTMPYAYALDNNLSDDFWTIRFVEA